MKYLCGICFTGSGVQDQLDALALPSTPTSTEMETTPSSPSISSSTTGKGCQQCMGLSQLSFAASTLSPATVQNQAVSSALHEHHVNPLHIDHSSAVAAAAQNLTQQINAAAGSFSVLNNGQNVTATFQGGNTAASLQTVLGGVSDSSMNGVKTENEDSLKL